MKQNEFNFEEYEDTIPELYKDIKVMMMKHVFGILQQ
jgi:hypothetical protein